MSRRHLRHADARLFPSASIRFVLPIANDQLLRLVLSGLYNLALFVAGKRKIDRLIERLSPLSDRTAKRRTRTCSSAWCTSSPPTASQSAAGATSSKCSCSATGSSCFPSMCTLDDFVCGSLSGRPSTRSYSFLHEFDEHVLRLQQVHRLLYRRRRRVPLAQGTKKHQTLLSSQMVLEEYYKINTLIKNSRLTSKRCAALSRRSSQTQALDSFIRGRRRRTRWYLHS